jgi:hypothetical protein
MTRISKLQRWLDIIAYLVGRRLPVSADELMRGVPSYTEVLPMAMLRMLG